MSGSYPPDPHYLRDLRLAFEPWNGGRRLRLPVTTAVCDESGYLRSGVLATAIDIAAGSMAGRLAAPDWVATSDISLHLLEPIAVGEVVLECGLVRHGRSLVVLELRAYLEGPDRNPCAIATAAFSILPSRGEAQGGGQRSRVSSRDFPRSDVPLIEPLVEKLGVHKIGGEPGSVEIRLSSYVRNTFGALQGGLAGVVSEIAMTRQAAALLGGRVRVSDLRLRYLAQGRVGPFVTDTEILRTAGGAVLVRVSLLDTGDGDRLITLATGTVIRDSD